MQVGAGLALAGCLGLARAQRCWGREAVGLGRRVLEASPKGCVPPLQVAAAGVSSPQNQLGAPHFLSLQFSPGTLHLEAASPGAPLRVELERPEEKPG